MRPFRTSSLGNLPIGSHHPPCPRHEHHIIWLFKHPFCLGCFSLYSGVLIGAVSCFFLLPGISLTNWFLLCTAGVSPTVLQPWMQKKTYKIFARFVLGVATIAWWFGAIGLGPIEFPDPLWTPICLLFFVGVALVLMTIRDRFTPNPCNQCPLGAFPTCSWNLDRHSQSDDELIQLIRNIQSE